MSEVGFDIQVSEGGDFGKYFREWPCQLVPHKRAEKKIAMRKSKHDYSLS